MSRQHRGISTKDLPVLPMPSPFDPELASRLLAKAGVRVSPAELKARASPTGPRRGDIRLELPRGGASSEAGSSVCGGDDPEDLTLPPNLRYGSPTPNNNTVITKVSGSGNSRNTTTTTAIAAKSLDTMHGNREANMAPLPPPGFPGHNPSATGSAILDTYLQFIAENSAGIASMALSPEQAAAAVAAHAAKMAQMTAMDKLGERMLEDYPMIGRDEGRGSGVVHEDRQDLLQGRNSALAEGESSGGEEDEFSDNDEAEMHCTANAKLKTQVPRRDECNDRVRIGRNEKASRSQGYSDVYVVDGCGVNHHSRCRARAQSETTSPDYILIRHFTDPDLTVGTRTPGIESRTSDQAARLCCTVDARQRSSRDTHRPMRHPLFGFRIDEPLTTRHLSEAD
ncbi:Protein abrupt [Harpegnathos saltator]|uniref:Protein abrupt n=1 Tax=Harpegnathos saltator TaxID=610380 RepID=E2BXY3_HARSA|nr:Protein abrupt [Harpegnathos saltator]